VTSAAIVFAFSILFADGEVEARHFWTRAACEQNRAEFIADLRERSRSDFFNSKPSEAAVGDCASVKLVLIRRQT
jgi:hypothetical protein